MDCSCCGTEALYWCGCVDDCGDALCYYCTYHFAWDTLDERLTPEEHGFVRIDEVFEG